MAMKVSCQNCSETISVSDNFQPGSVKCKCGASITNAPYYEDNEATRETLRVSPAARAQVVDHTAMLESLTTEQILGREKKNLAMDSVIGPYIIKKELGRGGMGVVYLAWDPKLQRDVAVKVLVSGEDSSEEQIMRFHKEAESTAKLQHPNIVSIFDVGISNNKHYIAMEYIHGKSLLEYTRNLANAERMKLMVKVCRAMDFCHERGILHRDLKPANILITESGEPKIMDFGLAKSATIEDTKLTRTGVIVGTPAYMSPEQAESAKDIDRRTDIYALGAITYEMFCGQTPFSGQSVLALLCQVVNEEAPTAKKLSRKVNDDLNTVIMKCLEKNPKNRYDTAEQLADDFEAVANSEPISAKPPSTVRRLGRAIRKNKVMTVVAVAVLVLCAGGWIGFGIYQRAEQEKQQANLNTAKSESEKKRVEMKAAFVQGLGKFAPSENPFAETTMQSLLAFAETPDGPSTLKENIGSSSENHAWGALLVARRAAPGKYNVEATDAFLHTKNIFVEKAAWDYLNEKVSLETIEELLSKPEGIYNPAVTGEIFRAFVDKTGRDKFREHNFPTASMAELQCELLEEKDSKTCAQPLIRRLESGLISDRVAVIDILAGREKWKNQTAGVMLKILIDVKQEEALRAKSAEALGALKEQTAIEPLLICLQEDKSEKLRSAAAAALARMNRTDVVPKIIAALNKRKAAPIAPEMISKKKESNDLEYDKEHKKQDVKMEKSKAFDQIEAKARDQKGVQAPAEGGRIQAEEVPVPNAPGAAAVADKSNASVAADKSFAPKTSAAMGAIKAANKIVDPAERQMFELLKSMSGKQYETVEEWENWWKTQQGKP